MRTLSLKYEYALLTFCCLLTACSNSKKVKEAEEVASILPEATSNVTVMTLKKQVFYHELVSNGKVSARVRADLRFENSEVIALIFVKNGDHVRKGQKIAELDKFKLANKVVQAKNAVERAKLDLKDVLIGQGYSLDEMNKVPDKVMKLAKVKSGYEQNVAEYELAKREAAHATLLAPFDGVIANLFTKTYNMANTSETFCSIVDVRGMEVDFTVLESELPLLGKGDRVSITPYADAVHKYDGQVSEINPLVDDNGMVKVKARINGNKLLFSGMNVRVSVRRAIGNQLVIPKTAVVMRSGKQVVFTLVDGKAQWNYVHTGLENADNYVVNKRVDDNAPDGLKEGDVVIVTGNVNLAHESPVKVMGHK
jgi:RND family efflux transporter MFP subunit